jgi:hypothetical protein
MEITAQHAKGQSLFTGQDMKERLLLNGVNLQSGDIPPGDLQLALSVEPHLTNAAPPFSNQTSMPTCIAAH